MITLGGMNPPPLTWLDLLAANMIAVGWLWGVMNAWRWMRTEQKRFFPGFCFVALLAFAFILAINRSQHWYEARGPYVPPVMVPALVQE